MPSKLNLIVRLQHWMDSVPGQTFLNYAYSWGASIIILGALFKLTHLPGANLMLYVGMGTEAFVFFLSAFDRPFDRTEIGKPLPQDFESDAEIEASEGWDQHPADALSESETDAPTAAAVSSTTEAVVLPTSACATTTDGPAQPTAAVTSQPLSAAATTEAAPHTTPDAVNMAAANDAPAAAVTPMNAAASFVAQHYDTPEGEATVAAEADKLAAIIRLANDELLRRAQAVLSPEMESATQDYIEKLRQLNTTLALVDEQSARLTRDSQEMENLNRTLVGINKIYDLHFASISRQVNTIEDINRQTQELATKIEEVNNIYSRMVQTLAFMGQVGAPAAAPPQP